MCRELLLPKLVPMNGTAHGRYSHYSQTTAAIVEKRLRTGKPVTDEMFLEAIDRLEPEFLPLIFMEALARELDPARNRRGRPKFGRPTRNGLIRRLQRIRSIHRHAVLFEGLIERLASGKRFSDHDLAVRRYKEFRRSDDLSLLRGLYRSIYELIEEADFIEHPVLGRLELPLTEGTRRERAAVLTSHVLNNRMGLGALSFQTMMNKISGNSRRKS